MEYTVGWADKDGKMIMEGSAVVDARTPYRAKEKFISPKVQGTKYEGFKMGFLVTLVRIKATIDDRFAEPVPDDFDHDAFIREVKLGVS